MNTFGFLKFRTAPIWATILASSAIFAGGVAYQWGGSCATCADQPACSVQQVCCPNKYAPKQITAYKTVYDTIYEQRQETTMVPTWETVMRTRKCTVSKPVTETAVREEKYTVRVPYTVQTFKTEKVQQVRYVEESSVREEVQTVCRPVTKTGQRERVYTVQRPVTKTVMVTQTKTVPVQETTMVTTCEDHGYYIEQTEFKERKPLFPNTLTWLPGREITDCATGESAYKPGGLHWVPRDVNKKGTYEVKKVWVPNKVTVQKPVTRTVMKQVCEQVPKTEVVMVPETVREMVPYTYSEMVQEQVVRKIPQKVLKPIVETIEKQVPVCETRYREEVRTRQVPYTVCRNIQEEKVEQYPVRVCKYVPVTKTVCVPRVVARTVPCTSLEYVPVTSCCSVGAPVPASCDSNLAPYSPSPAPGTSQESIPPAQYNPPAAPTPETTSNDVANSDKSILVKDNEVKPATYTDQSSNQTNNDALTNSNDISNAKFEQVYPTDDTLSNNGAANDAANNNTTNSAEPAPAASQPEEPAAPASTPADTNVNQPDQPREITAPTESQPMDFAQNENANSGMINVDANASIPTDLSADDIPTLPAGVQTIPASEPEY